MTNREERGLRGPVKTCLEEAIHPAVTSVFDGTQHPEQKSWYTTEYDSDGRTVTTRSSNSAASHSVMRYIYDDSGRLLKTTWGKEGEPAHETVYTYDDQGRPLKITSSARSYNPVTFRYDERGRKTKVQVSRPQDYKARQTTGGSPFFAADMPPNFPEGGMATTIYDELDRATEVQVRNSEDELVGQAVRIYDAAGRIAEEKYVLEKPEAMFPANALAEILKASRASREALREHLRKLMGGADGMSAMRNTYDAQGRLKQTSRRIFGGESVIETTYNEHGDKAVEITRSMPAEQDSQWLPEYSEVRYSYEYDSHGNWIEQKSSFRSTPDGILQPSTVLRRTLTYY